ncbi:MAG: hypothetical protein V7754_17005 [Halioglobus sp.]
MPRPLTIAAILLTALTGCSVAPSGADEPRPPGPQIEVCQCDSGPQEWLDLHREIAALTTEEVAAHLVLLTEPEGSLQLYYFALLHQQLNVVASWTEARDAFRTLGMDTQLSPGKQQLAVIMERYNQSRINWHELNSQLQNDHDQLQSELQTLKEENALLEQKIQAITDLETSISTRKEL